MLRLYTTLFFWMIKKNGYVIFRAFLSKVEQFRKKLQDVHTVVFFSSVNELKALISASLTHSFYIK